MKGHDPYAPPAPPEKEPIPWHYRGANWTTAIGVEGVDYILANGGRSEVQP